VVEIQRHFAEASLAAHHNPPGRLCPEVWILSKLTPAEEHLLINTRKSSHVLFASSPVYFGGREHE